MKNLLDVTNDPYNYNVFNPLPDNVVPQEATNPVIKDTVSYMNKLHDAYANAGITYPMLDYNIVQDYMESNGFTNSGAGQYNPGNIMWFGKGLNHGKKGTYNRVNKSYYASFDNLNDYVAEKIKLLNKAPGTPINATSLQDFAHRLKQNNYYGKASETGYINALNDTAKKITNLAALQTYVQTPGNNLLINPTANKINDMQQGVKDFITSYWKPVAAVTVGIIILRFIRKR